MEKIVGFVGYECEDIAVYLARILSLLGKRVAIIDRTEQEMLLEIMGMQNGKENCVREGEFYGIWITGQGVNYEEYDVVFLLFGYRLIHPKLYECESLIMVTDGVPAHALLLRKIGHWNRKQYLLIRNLVPMKHTEQYLAMLADNEADYCEIPYDEQDARMRYSLGSFAGCGMKHLSVGMKRSLIGMVRFLTMEYQEKQIRELIKKH